MRALALVGLYAICAADDDDCFTYCLYEQKVLCCKEDPMDAGSPDPFYNFACGPDGQTPIDPKNCEHVTTTSVPSTNPTSPELGSSVIISVVVAVVLGVVALLMCYSRSKKRESSQRLLTRADAADSSALHGLDPESLAVDKTSGERQSPNAVAAAECDIFLSLRFTDSDLKAYAHHLKNDLQEAGHKVFLCTSEVGEQFGPSINVALNKCKYFIPLITLHPMYGEDTGCTYSTYHEFLFAGEYHKTICPVMMYKDTWPPEELKTKLHPVLRNGETAGANLFRFLMPSLPYTQSDDCSEQSAHVVSRKLLQSMHGS